jgi:hypothetical protein
MDLVEDLAEPGVSVHAACEALGLSRATAYRSTSPDAPPAVRERRANPRRLSDDERKAIVDVMHAPEFVDQPPMEVLGKLLSQGIYLASIRWASNTRVPGVNSRRCAVPNAVVYFA